MPRRTNLNNHKNVQNADDLEREVQDKRFGKRAKSKKNRRNRHYVKNMLKQMEIDIRNTDEMDD